MANIFTQAFNSYAGHGDKITAEHDGFKLVATIHADNDRDPPWDKDCGHGPVSEWQHKTHKRAGERILCSDGDRARFYDFAEACKIALRDGWSYGDKYARDHIADAKAKGETLTLRMVAAKAAELDFAVLKAWCDGDWSYCGIAVTVSRHGIQLVGKYDSATWGIELNYPDSKNAYLAEMAEEQAREALSIARENMAKLCVVPAPSPKPDRPGTPERAQALRTRLVALATRRAVKPSSTVQGA